MTQLDKHLGCNSTQSNFTFLKQHDAIFLQLAQTAEQAFTSDPNTTLVKLRQFAEAIAQDLAMRCRIEFDHKTSQADLLFRINRELRLESQIISLFHGLRKAGNQAVHQFKTEHKSALAGLKVARDIAFGITKHSASKALSLNQRHLLSLKIPAKS
nr:DUF4145 domain-containing protein [Shewanella surugensis]